MIYGDPYYGIDVSEHQGDISWDAIKNADLHYAWIKTSEGVGFTDSKWWRNRGEAIRTGIPWGGYHFARANGPDWWADARAEAEWFVDQDGMSGSLPGMLDMEHTELSSELTLAWADTFCQRVHELCGRLPVVYWGAYFAEHNGQAAMNDPRMQSCVWWMPAYTSSAVDPDPMAIPNPNMNGPRKCNLWQYTSQGRIPGYGGNLDLNVAEEATIMGLLGEEPDPVHEEDDMSVALWWTKVGSEWAAEKAFLDNTVSHCFRVDGPTLHYLGTEDPTMVGTNAVIQAQRMELQMAGYFIMENGRSPKEGLDISDENFRGRSIIGDVLALPRAIHTEGSDAQWVPSLTDVGVAKTFIDGSTGKALRRLNLYEGVASFKVGDPILETVKAWPDTPVGVIIDAEPDNLNLTEFVEQLATRLESVLDLSEEDVRSIAEETVRLIGTPKIVIDQPT